MVTLFFSKEFQLITKMQRKAKNPDEMYLRGYLFLYISYLYDINVS